MDLNLTLSFLAASIALTFMPGPDNLFVLTESLTKGPRNGIAVSAGLASGILVHTLAASTGISLLIQKSDMAFAVLKYIGAAYLFYMAYNSMREKRPEMDLTHKTIDASKSFVQLMRKGFFMSALNPKVSLFFIAFLPQFVSKTGFHSALQMIILGIIFMIQALLIFSAISLLSGQLSPFLNKPRFWDTTKWVKTGILAALGLILALARK